MCVCVYITNKPAKHDITNVRTGGCNLKKKKLHLRTNKCNFSYLIKSTNTDGVYEAADRRTPNRNWTIGSPVLI